MADVPNPTSNVTLYNEIGNNVNVNDNVPKGVYELHVVDSDALDLLQAIADGTGNISNSVTTSWEYFSSIDKGFITSYGAQFGGGTTEQAFMLIRNPAASGYLVRMKRLTFQVTSNTTGVFRLYRLPTITAVGTTNFIENYRDVTVTGVALAYSVPTYSATGSTWARYDLNAGGVGVLVIEQDLALTLLEGDDLLITLEQGSNNNKFSANFSWAEEEIV